MGDFVTAMGVANLRGSEILGADLQVRTATDLREKTLEEAIREFKLRMESLERSLEEGGQKDADVLKELGLALDELLNAAESYERKEENPERIREMRAAFHRATHGTFAKSYLVNRARTWPSGYQGDHKMLETIYRSLPLSKGLGYYIDLYALRSTLALGVRNRMKILIDILADELNNRTRPKILNIGCGSCRELFDIVPEIIRSRATITCLDSDEDALLFSQNRISYTEATPRISFRKYNALRLFDAETALNDIGKQDIIYSAGLFDYLDSDFLVKVISTLYGLLNKGGRLIAPFKDAERYRPSIYHWITDWDGFKQRTEKEFSAIMRRAGIPSDATQVRRDGTGAIIFYSATKI